MGWYEFCIVTNWLLIDSVSETGKATRYRKSPNSSPLKTCCVIALIELDLAIKKSRIIVL
jgi:hypothetical protein